MTGADATNANVAGTLAAAKEGSKQRDSAANSAAAVSAADITHPSRFGAAPELSVFLRVQDKLPQITLNFGATARSSCDPGSTQSWCSNKSSTPSYKEVA